MSVSFIAELSPVYCCIVWYIFDISYSWCVFTCCLVHLDALMVFKYELVSRAATPCFCVWTKLFWLVGWLVGWWALTLGPCCLSVRDPFDLSMLSLLWGIFSLCLSCSSSLQGDHHLCCCFLFVGLFGCSLQIASCLWASVGLWLVLDAIASPTPLSQSVGQ